MPDPVIRAETFYTPPTTVSADAWRLKAPSERVIAWYEHKQQRRLPRPEGVLLGESRWARIDAGRWVADCPCGSAQIVTPADQRMFCVECLSGWHTVMFPADVAAAEQTVAELPPHARFWWHPDDSTSWNRPLPELTEKQLALAAQPPAQPDPGV